ncbi:MAG: hypothetical protein GF387_03560 [Candidatus Portnoybacteria bacterium]|nr:hypothetical protein [Candidatus Portnoybacteria bacterium]
MRKVFLFFSCLLVIFLFTSCDGIFSPSSPSEPGDIEVRRISVTVEYERTFDKGCATYSNNNAVNLEGFGQSRMNQKEEHYFVIEIQNVRADSKRYINCLDGYFYNADGSKCYIRAHNIWINGVKAPYEKNKATGEEWITLYGFDENNKPIFD